MLRIHSLYLAKLLFKVHIPSFRNCTIDRTARINAQSVLSDVKMGRYSYTGAGVYISDAEIGSFCCIANHVTIGGGQHPMDTVSMSPVFLQGKNFLKTNFANIPYERSIKTIIGNDVWIGENAYIKSGITIGDGAVIGAHAVVTHDIRPYAVVVGVPAKEIYRRFSDDIVIKLLRLKWWNWNEEKLKQNGELFRSPLELLDKMGEES